MASKKKREWFFHRFQELLYKMNTKEDLDFDLPGALIGYNMVKDAQSLGPEGAVERTYTGRDTYIEEKASERRGRTKGLKESWNWKTRKTDGDVSIQLTNTAPYARWVAYGTEPHRIPLQGLAKPLLFFFWENRTGATGRRWGPSASGHEGGENWRTFGWVDHPGAAANLFLKFGVKERAKKRDKAEIAGVYGRWLTNIHKDFGFKVLKGES